MFLAGPYGYDRDRCARDFGRVLVQATAGLAVALGSSGWWDPVGADVGSFVVNDCHGEGSNQVVVVADFPFETGRGFQTHRGGGSTAAEGSGAPPPSASAAHHPSLSIVLYFNESKGYRSI